MEDLTQKIKDLNKLLAQIEKLLIRIISFAGWILILTELLKQGLGFSSLP